MFDYFELVGRDVEVMADGILYQGKLVEMGEEDLHLESPSGWMTIRLDRVTDVHPAASD